VGPSRYGGEKGKGCRPTRHDRELKGCVCWGNEKDQPRCLGLWNGSGQRGWSERRGGGLFVASRWGWEEW